MNKQEKEQVKADLKDRIVASAIRSATTDKVYLGTRHHHAYWHAAVEGNEDINKSEFEEGFWLASGRFIGREEAAILAINTGQLKPGLIAPQWGKELFSEDLW